MMTSSLLKARFRGFYPVVIDIESGGFDPHTNPILEIAACTVKMDNDGWLEPDQTLAFNVKPFDGCKMEQSALAFNGIDPDNPLRDACSEREAIQEIFKMVRKGIKEQDCNRAVIVAHNAHFDHSFLMTAAERCEVKRNPFHPFATFDTATLSGLAFGQTVLAKACKIANIPFDHKKAHSALYDTVQTTQLFCEIVNRWKRLGGWPLSEEESKSDHNENTAE